MSEPIETGSITVYTKKESRGKEVKLRNIAPDQYKLGAVVGYANVVERMVDNQPVFSAVFPRIPPGNYTLFPYPGIGSVTNITVHAGEITEVDWR